MNHERNKDSLNSQDELDDKARIRALLRPPRMPKKTHEWFLSMTSSSVCIAIEELIFQLILLLNTKMHGRTNPMTEHETKTVPLDSGDIEWLQGVANGSLHWDNLLSAGRAQRIVSALTAAPSQPAEPDELARLCSAIGITPESIVDDIKQTAMNRSNVGGKKREHIQRILDCAFDLLAEKCSGADELARVCVDWETGNISSNEAMLHISILLKDHPTEPGLVRVRNED